MDKASLKIHEESHMPNEQRKYVCDICHKTFTHITDLTMHKKYHDPEKKFDCEVCGREFNRLNNLQRHMMVHQQVCMIFVLYVNLNLKFFHSISRRHVPLTVTFH